MAVKQKLKEAFPSKEPLRLQTDLFAERRSKALDAYLQILTHCLRERGLLSREMIKDFFGIKEIVVKETKLSPGIKTPNALNAEIDKLRSALYNSTDPKSLKDDFDAFQNLIDNLGERREAELIEKFYEVKREWEVKKIRNGQFEADSFDFCFYRREKMSTACGKGDHTAADSNNTSSNRDSTVTVNQMKWQLRDQEAILSDLAETLQQQKQLSMEICEEIKQQNRVMSEFGNKQEGTIGDFIQSSEKARKLQ